MMTMASVGSWLGGYLPTWIGGIQNISATDSTAYGNTILVSGVMAVIAILPLIFMKSPKILKTERAVFAPFE